MKRDKHIYFILSDSFLGDDGIATADGTHPTDVGFSRMLEGMTPPLKKIFVNMEFNKIHTNRR